MEALLYSIYHDISETTPAGKAKSSYEAWYRNPSVSRIETIGNEVYYKDFAVSADQTLPAISFPDQIANKTLPEGEIIPDAGRNWARYIGMMALYGHELLQEIEIIPSSFYDHEGLIGQMCRESLTILNARNSSEKAFDKLIPNHRKLAYKGVHIAHSETAETATLFHFE